MGRRREGRRNHCPHQAPASTCDLSGVHRRVNGYAGGDPPLALVSLPLLYAWILRKAGDDSADSC